MTRNAVVLLVISSLAVFSGCGASSTNTAQDTSNTTGSNSGAQGTDSNGKATSSGGDNAKSVTFPQANADTLSLVEFGGANQLFVGTQKGKVGIARIAKREGSVGTPATQVDAPIRTVAPDGSLAVIETDPTKVVNMRGELILNANTVGNLAGATFAKNDYTLYISAEDGTIRIWGQAHSFADPEPQEKMEDYLNRQGSDFNINVGPLRGPLHSTSNGHIVMTDDQGVVRLWNPRKPSKSKRVMKLDGTARSVSTSGDDIVTTSSNGSLKVGRLDPPSYLPWSRDEKADYAAASDAYYGKFVQLGGGKVRAREIETGEEVWSTDVPAGNSCGLTMSPDGSLVAACVNNFVVILNTSDGAWDSTAYFDGTKFKWVDATGAEILTK